MSSGGTIPTTPYREAKTPGPTFPRIEKKSLLQKRLDRTTRGGRIAGGAGSLPHSVAEAGYLMSYALGARHGVVGRRLTPRVGGYYCGVVPSEVELAAEGTLAPPGWVGGDASSRAVAMETSSLPVMGRGRRHSVLAAPAPWQSFVNQEEVVSDDEIGNDAEGEGEAGEDDGAAENGARKVDLVPDEEEGAEPDEEAEMAGDYGVSHVDDDEDALDKVYNEDDQATL